MADIGKKVSKAINKFDPLTKGIGKALGIEEIGDPLGIFPSTPEAPDLEKIAPTQVMPVADERALATARKRAAARKRGGRVSTVLSLGAGAGKKSLGG